MVQRVSLAVGDLSVRLLERAAFLSRVKRLRQDFALPVLFGEAITPLAA
jgi:hypothetical protein